MKSLRRKPKFVGAFWRAIQAIGLVSLSGLPWAFPLGVFAQTAQDARDADRGSQFFVNTAAARAATEKVLAQMTADFYAGGIYGIDSNFPTYTSLVPLPSDNLYWSNFVFLAMYSGVTNPIYVFPPSPVIEIGTSPETNGELQGMNTFHASYQISAFARQANNGDKNLIGGTLLEATFASVPLFEFAIFYNGLLEFTTSGSLTITGPVYANSNIYVGSANPLTFNFPVTTTGIITNAAWAGDTQSQFTGKVTYNGTPFKTNTREPAIYPPFGSTNNAPTNLIQMLYPPVPGDSVALTQQRYYNKAEMLITVSNGTFFPSNNLVTIKLQAPPTNGLGYQDTAPYWFTNLDATSGATNSAWSLNGFDYWLSTTNQIYDCRQNQYIRITQINVSNFNTWCLTNLYAYNTASNFSKFSHTVPLNIVYVGDWRAFNGGTNSAVRLVGGGSTNFPNHGLTVATPNPLYIWGNYDTPLATNLNSTNVTGTYPTSFACDALTILSTNWSDNYGSTTPLAGRMAGNTTVNGAIIAGAVYSTGPGGTGTTQFSGGVQNLPRLLENWTNSTLTLNTSLVNLYPSAIATAPFIWPSANLVYGAPLTRQYFYNQNYNLVSGLPPGTPTLETYVQRTAQLALNFSGTPP